MRKPNTSLRGYETPSLRPHEYRTERCENGTPRLADYYWPASPQNLQHWTKERPESLQAKQLTFRFYGKSNTLKNNT